QQPWLVQLNYLRLSDPAVAPMPEPDANRPSALAQFDPAQAIPIDVQIARLWRGDEDLGSISFQLRPIDHGLRLLNVSGTLRNVTLAQRDDRPTSLTWTRRDGVDHSAFGARLNVTDAADALRSWRYEPVLTSRSEEHTSELQSRE